MGSQNPSVKALFGQLSGYFGGGTERCVFHDEEIKIEIEIEPTTITFTIRRYATEPFLFAF